MKWILYLVLILTLTSCTWFRDQFGCAVEKQLVTNVAPAIATALQCKNQGEIEKDLKSVSTKLKLCANPVETSTLSTICIIVAPALASLTTDTLVPRNWECSATAAKSALAGVLDKACQAIP